METRVKHVGKELRGGHAVLPGGDKITGGGAEEVAGVVINHVPDQARLLALAGIRWFAPILGESQIAKALPLGRSGWHLFLPDQGRPPRAWH